MPAPKNKKKLKKNKDLNISKQPGRIPNSEKVFKSHGQMVKENSKIGRAQNEVLDIFMKHQNKPKKLIKVTQNQAN